MHIQIISVGTKPRPALQSMITTYESRLPRSIQLSWVFIKHGSGDAQASMKQEAEKILKSIPAQHHVVLLDEVGTQYTSEQFSEQFIQRNRDVCFIIGGAYGVAQEIVSRADTIVSLSKLVFPHQLVRLLLVEQLYRAHTIAQDHPYHHS